MSPTTARLLDRLAAALDTGPPVVAGEPPEHAAPDGTAVVLRTSGSSSGTGRPVALSRDALRASASATHDRLGGPGRWVLALRPQHVAGVQVLVRSVVAGTVPLELDGERFDPVALAGLLEGAADEDGSDPLYLSLVPTQLVRVLEAGQDAVAATRRCAAVLVGGSATPPGLLRRARDAGLRVVTTYGMTETCGGCVYDGVPLAGVQVAVQDGALEIAGDVLMSGYLDDGPQPVRSRDGRRWLRTADAGRLDPATGTLQVLGRLDDVVVTGGVNVQPALVERRLATALGVDDVVVVGVPDAEWGQLLTAVLVTGDVGLDAVRRAAGGGAEAPRALVRLPALPLRGPGKPDRRAVQELAQAALDRGEAERHRPAR